MRDSNSGSNHGVEPGRIPPMVAPPLKRRAADAVAPTGRDPVDDQPAGRLAALRGRCASWLLSAVVHVILLLVLGLLSVAVSESHPKRMSLLTSVAGEEVELLEDLLIDSPLDDTEPDQAPALAVKVDDPGLAAFGEPPSGPTMAEFGDVGARVMPSTMDELGTLFGKDGKGYASFGEGPGGAMFYGVKSRGRKFVFVVDNSLSMRGGQFEAVCHELLGSVSRLNPRQSFYVLFFSDTAYPLFYPQSAKDLVPATDSNRYRLQGWLRTIQLVLHTNAKQAVLRALAMKPDAVYILTDGAFTDDTAETLWNMPRSKIPIHTVGMQVQPQHGQVLQAISRKHHGTYRYVQIDPRWDMLAQNAPRKLNRERGPVWGIALAEKRQNRPANAPKRRPPGKTKKKNEAKRG